MCAEEALCRCSCRAIVMSLAEIATTANQGRANWRFKRQFARPWLAVVAIAAKLITIARHEHRQSASSAHMRAVDRDRNHEIASSIRIKRPSRNERSVETPWSASAPTSLSSYAASPTGACLRATRGRRSRLILMVIGGSLDGSSGCRAGSPFSAVAFVEEPEGCMTETFALRPGFF